MYSPQSAAILDQLKRVNSIDQAVLGTLDLSALSTSPSSSPPNSLSSSEKSESTNSIFHDVPSAAPSEACTPRLNTPSSSFKFDAFHSRVRTQTHTPPRPQRHISFSNRCSVVLIPTRKEYLSAGLGLDLWVSRQEQLAAQQEVTEEVRGLLDSNPALTMRKATSFLYQPRRSDDEEDEEEDDDDEGEEENNNNTNSMKVENIENDDDDDKDDDHDEKSEKDVRINVRRPPTPCVPKKSRATTATEAIAYTEDSPKPSSPCLRSRSSSLSSPPHWYSDSKQRLNILIADTTPEGFECTEQVLKQELLSHERWVVSFKHCTSDVEMLEMLFGSSSSRVSKIDVVVIDESICELVSDRHDADVKALIEDVKTASDDAVVGLLLSSENSLYYAHKDAAKRGGVDFVWDKPIQRLVPMLPLLLADK